MTLTREARKEMSFAARPIRVLHVVGGMNRGGVETWLMHLLRRVDRGRLQMDFLVQTDSPCAYDAEIRDLGCADHFLSRASASMDPRPKPAPNSCAYGPYDVVHSHVHRFSGFVLKVAQACGVPVRIAHSHSDTSQLDRRAAPLRQLYLNCMGRWIRRNATKGLAVSREAATSLFGPQWEKDGRFRIAYCGVDLAPFRNLPDAGSVRSELGIPAGAFVVGHVGRFEPPKNHAFLVEIATELVRIDCNARFLWVGDGTLRRATEEKVARAGLTRNVSFTGARSDVPCLLAAMDAFVFPSLYEGLGLVLIEAQAVGLPCFVADVLTREAKVVEPLFTPLSLLESPSTWAERILAVRSTRPPVSRTQALALVEQSPFNIESSVRTLEEVYHDR